jgi:NADPH2:quinone reductase
VAKETLTLPIPESMGFDEAAACALVCFTSYNLLKTAARLAKGETVLIHAAAGGVGTTAIQLAKILGASKVIGTVGSDEKARVVQSLGADYVVNYRKERFVEKVLEWTEGEGVDVILDSVAGEVGEESMKCLARYGRLVNYGNLGGRESTYYTNQLQASCRSVIGFSFGTTRKYRPEIIREQAHEIFKYVTERQLKVIISKKYDLHQAEDAHRFIESRKSIGKVILIP